MSERIAYVLIGLVLLVVTYYFTFVSALEPVAGIGLIHIFAGVLAGWLAIRIGTSLRRMTPAERAADPVFSDLFIYFLAASLFNFIDFIPHYLLIILDQPISTITIVHWSGHIFRFLELIMAARICTAFFNPKLRGPVTIFGVIIAVIGLGASLLSPDRLVPIPNAEHPLLLSTEFFAKMDVGLTGLLILPAALYLIFSAFKLQNAHVRMLAILSGIGFAFDFGQSLMVNYAAAMFGPGLAPLFINFFILMAYIVLGYVGITLVRDRKRGSSPTASPAPVATA